MFIAVKFRKVEKVLKKQQNKTTCATSGSKWKKPARKEAKSSCAFLRSDTKCVLVSSSGAENIYTVFVCEINRICCLSF